MSIPLPLAVRLATPKADMNVTAQLRELQFRSLAVGGFASAAISLDRPLSLQPDEISYYGKVYIYDARSAATVWEGRIEDPGRSAGDDGQVWELKAVGPSAHALDRNLPLIYVDSSLDRWYTPAYSQPVAQTEKRNADTWQMMYNRGVNIINGWEAAIAYDAISLAGQFVARINTTWDTGATSVNMELRAWAVPASSVADSDLADPAGGTLTASLGGSPTLPAGTTSVHLVVRRITSDFLLDNDTFWFQFINPVVRARLKTKAGADITSGYTADTILASEVVADLLGRLLPMYDGANAKITTTAFGIDQLAYPDGVNAAQVLADLLGFEPDYRWAAWESNPAGKHRFEFVPWPTQVRYEADIVDGYESMGSADGLYNAVLVRYSDMSGQVKTVRRTSSVPELTAAGLTREAVIDLGDEMGTVANANRVGDKFLLQHVSAPNAGRLTVARPIQDLVTGQMVAPWEIRPGHLIRVRGVLPRVDALNTTTRDGVTVFRLMSTDFRAAACAADLELDSFAPSTSRTLADLQSRPSFRRR